MTSIVASFCQLFLKYCLIFRRRQPWRASDYCRQYDDDQLYDKLEQVGALNQRYMANSPEDAGRNFAHSYDAPPNTVDSMPVTAFDDALDDFSVSLKFFNCCSYCAVFETYQVL